MRKLLATLLAEFKLQIDLTRDSVQRQLAFPDTPEMIKVAIGMRRSGKSYFLFQNIHRLLAQGVSEERILYINFEDDRLLPLNAKEMGALVDAFYSIYPDNHQQLCYLFLDEVQNVDGWPLVIRRLHDKKNAQIFITGSSAKLLSTEIATSLRGRSIAIDVWPYSFSEFLDAHHITLPKRPYGRQAYDKLAKVFTDYLAIGGFPGVQQLTEVNHRSVLQNYVDTVVLRDVIERHNISNVTMIKYLIGALLKNFASTFSINKFYNDLRSQGYKLGKDTLYNYINYIEDAYLLFSVSAFSESLRKKQTLPKKIYAIDSGLIKANIMSISDKLGNFLENLVYLDLRRRGDKIHYYRTDDGYEVDFFTETVTGEVELIQVVWSLEDAQTISREQRALDAAQKELGIKGRIIDLQTYLDGISNH